MGAGAKHSFAHRNGSKHSVSSVSPDPVIGDCFSWARVRATQCGGKYSVPENSSERTHFTTWAAKAIAHACTITDAPSSPLMRSISDAIGRIEESQGTEAYSKKLESILVLINITYRQLVPVFEPPRHLFSPPSNEPDYVPASQFETVTVSVPPKRSNQKPQDHQYVLSPQCVGGRVFDIVGTKARSWKVHLLFRIFNIDFDLDEQGDPAFGSMDYALDLEPRLRTMDHIYSPEGMSHRDRCACLRVGRMNCISDELIPMPMRYTEALTTFMPKSTESDCVMVHSKEIVESLFSQVPIPNPYPLHTRVDVVLCLHRRSGHWFQPYPTMTQSRVSRSLPQRQMMMRMQMMWTRPLAMICKLWTTS